MPGLLLLKDLLEKIQWYSGCSFWSAVVGISFNVISYPWVYQFSISSVTQSCSTLCNLINRSTPGLRVHHKLPESTQTHVHWVGDAIQTSHPLLSPSPPVPNPSQCQSLFQWVNSLHEVAKVLELLLQHQSFQWIFRTDFLEDWLVGSPFSPKDSQESSSVPQLESIDSLALNLLYGPALTSINDYWISHCFDYMGLCQKSNVFTF